MEKIIPQCNNFLHILIHENLDPKNCARLHLDEPVSITNKYVLPKPNIYL